MAERVLFIDRDGTLVEEPEDFQVDALNKIRLVPGVIPALLELAAHGFRLVMVSNQDGLGTDSFPEAQFRESQDHILALFETQGVQFDEIFICPHLPEDLCECRKPRTGLLTRYLAETTIDLGNSAVIGDRDTDIELAERIGVQGLRISDGGPGWPDIVRRLCYAERQARVERKTKETTIVARVNLDCADPVTIRTGIGFYDHMLEQIARHGGFSLALECDGDLHVDDHHTIEDTAICLGEVLRTALGNKRGVGRYGFVVPMDESEARASVDLSGRGNVVFTGEFPRDSVGGLATEMVKHFFGTLADALGAAIHVDVRGENTHHMVEACFKSVGRCLRDAIRRSGTDMPSTKGMLA
ncbi:MAG: bifunctional histidinol-phosphatase/imidazoleglycerol-phosphate dehydratase HisB [Woeseiaceae bacterium]|nr:bifunctional histidinol-phosphatase/imidazoleglycerol-phosphate dehydratase HisB [Woeseiaceae bacterium]